MSRHRCTYQKAKDEVEDGQTRPKTEPHYRTKEPLVGKYDGHGARHIQCTCVHHLADKSMVEECNKGDNPPPQKRANELGRREGHATHTQTCHGFVPSLGAQPIGVNPAMASCSWRRRFGGGDLEVEPPLPPLPLTSRPAKAHFPPFLPYS